jgi:hypothetical protein
MSTKGWVSSVYLLSMRMCITTSVFSFLCIKKIIKSACSPFYKLHSLVIQSKMQKFLAETVNNINHYEGKIYCLFPIDFIKIIFN